MSAFKIAAVVAGVAVLGAGAYLVAPNLLSGPSSASNFDAPPPQMRRMTEEQYRNSIKDVFSEDISVVGRFEPDVRIDGLAAVGSSVASISASGYEHYYAMAGRVAEQVISEDNWARFMSSTTVTVFGFGTIKATEKPSCLLRSSHC